MWFLFGTDVVLDEVTPAWVTHIADQYLDHVVAHGRRPDIALSLSVGWDLH